MVWSGQGWRVAAEFPDTREDALLVYDAARSRLLLLKNELRSIVSSVAEVMFDRIIQRPG